MRNATPEQVLAELKRLAEEIAGAVVPISAKIQVDILGTILDTYKAQLEYERLRRFENIDPVDFFEGGQLLTGADAATIREG